MHIPRSVPGLLAVPFLAALIPAQCDQPQGNARLGLSGLPYLGSNVTFAMEGRPNARFLLAMSLPPQAPIQVPWGTICLDPAYELLVAGLLLDRTGVFTTHVTIPPDPALKGVTACFQGGSDDPAAPNGFLALSNAVRMTVQGVSPVDTVFFEDFEVNRGGWFASNGLWSTGTPTNVGPAAPYSGTCCAGTALDGRYPAGGADTRLEGPRITLPAIGTGEEIRVGYRVWFDTEKSYDYAQLVVSENLSTWQTLPASPVISGWSGAWTQCSADLSAFAGKPIYLGFRFVSRNACTYTSSCFRDGAGVYIDDIHVYRGQPRFAPTETFEEGIGFWWSSDNGLWQVGEPTVGPQSPASSGSKACAGTLLHGNYPSGGSNTRLISPPIALPPASGPVRSLIFNEWIHTELNYDKGVIQVSADGGATWQTLSTAASTGSSTMWTAKRVPLIDDPSRQLVIQGKTVLVAFYFESTNACTYTSSCFRNGNGWYLDDIRIR